MKDPAVVRQLEGHREKEAARIRVIERWPHLRRVTCSYRHQPYDENGIISDTLVELLDCGHRRTYLPALEPRPAGLWRVCPGCTAPPWARGIALFLPLGCCWACLSTPCECSAQERAFNRDPFRSGDVDRDEWEDAAARRAELQLRMRLAAL